MGRSWPEEKVNKFGSLLLSFPSFLSDLESPFSPLLPSCVTQYMYCTHLPISKGVLLTCHPHHQKMSKILTGKKKKVCTWSTKCDKLNNCLWKRMREKLATWEATCLWWWLSSVRIKRGWGFTEENDCCLLYMYVPYNSESKASDAGNCAFCEINSLPILVSLGARSRWRQ